ncbi:MAG: helix-turn-helix transcriptional regulator [Pegethrix bostrychoides GSE-TBD4-15B]|jgi:putative transcriptional regulator|uniref:Helix-turn-helix transcriptional regulator n=1 Tax=Pegethrix bostrychoides GSE-TBD4-15B TaxID=2839662 RepID=A0A951U6S2_9CYAN|nr:helix-turn-helix transcriptional regulator [Pegethrix bostrychoides GSE-TBD4-15B]
MRIEWQLAKQMAKQGMNYRMLGRATGLHPNTISKLKHKPPVRLEMETLTRLCKALDCQPGDLLAYSAEPGLEPAPSLENSQHKSREQRQDCRKRDD